MAFTSLIESVGADLGMGVRPLWSSIHGFNSYTETYTKETRKRSNGYGQMDARFFLENQGKIKNPRTYTDVCGLDFGGDEGDRTPDLCIANAALSQLSYTPKQTFVHKNISCEGGIMP